MRERWDDFIENWFGGSWDGFLRGAVSALAAAACINWVVKHWPDWGYVPLAFAVGTVFGGAMVGTRLMVVMRDHQYSFSLMPLWKRRAERNAAKSGEEANGDE